MVREKGKYEYNKQEIPENLKYHSDDSDSSEISELRKSKKLEKLKMNNNMNNTNNDKASNNRQITPKISVKRQNSGVSKKDLSIKNKKNIKEINNNQKNSEEENNSPNLPKNNNGNNNDAKFMTPID